MIRRILVVALVLVTCIAPASVAAKERPLAVVGEDPIYGDELREEFVRRHGGHAKFLGGPAEARAFLDQVIDRRLLLQEAYRLGLDELPAIRAAVAELAEQKAVEWLVTAETEAKAPPTDAEIRAAWEQHTTTIYSVLQIVVADRADAEAAAAELAAGADFQRLAATRSTARSRIRGGALPSIGWGTMSPAWEAAVFPLEPGQTSPPFASDEGWEIVRMVAKNPVEKPDFERARPRIETILKQRKLEAARAAFSTELWTKYHARLASVIELTPAALVELHQAAPATTLASWDGGTLDLATFAQGLDLAALAALPAARGQAQIDDLLRRTVNDALARREAVARGVAAQPEVVTKVVAHREQLMERALYADHLLRGVAVEESEVRAWYDEHRAELAAPARRRVAQIVTKTEADAIELRRRIEQGEDFAELARTASTDPQSGKVGGDLGWITAAETPPAFRPVLELAAGEVSQPLASEFGWHLIRVVEVQAARDRTYEEIHEQLRQELLEGERTAKRKEWVRRLREATPIRIDERAIETFAKKAAE